MMIRHTSKIVAVAMLLMMTLLTVAGTAVANSAPPRWHGDQGGIVVPEQSTSVHILREMLRFELNEGLSKAQVTARYEMENRGAALSEMPVVFVLRDSRGETAPNLQVTWNGQAVASEALYNDQLTPAQRQAMDAAWSATEVVMDPVTGERYDSSEFYGGTGVRYFRFALTMAAGETGSLEVRYEHQAAVDRTRYVHHLFHYQYLLLPARAWASFGPLEIAVKAPPAREVLFGTTIPLTYEDGEYRTTLPGLPEENLSFSVMSRKGILFGWMEPGPYFWLAFAALLPLSGLVGLGLGWAGGFIRSRGWAITLAVVLSIAAGFMANVLLAFILFAAFPLSNQSYGLAIMAFLQGFVATVVTLVVAIIKAARRSDQRRLTAGG